MNRREVFDKVRNHLLQQGRRSVDVSTGTACRYRGNGGLTCAIGCLIPDELYRPEIECLQVSHPIVQNILRQVGIDVEDTSQLLSALQDCHDSVLPFEWDQALQRIEVQYVGT